MRGKRRKMKLTRSSLRRIIKEELGRVLSEQDDRVTYRHPDVHIKGSPPADEEESMLLDLLVSDDMPPDWDYSTDSERNAFYQALGSAALKHFRSLPPKEIPLSGMRLGQHLMDRIRELPELGPYARELIGQVRDAATVAGSEAKGSRTGMASPD